MCIIGSDSDEWPLSRVMVHVFVSLFGLALIGFVAYWIRVQEAKEAVKTITEFSAAAAAQLQRSLAETQRRADREKAERAAAQRRVIEEQNARIAAIQEQEQRKEAAWSRFYVPSDFCKDANNRATMQCANEYARTRR